MILTMRIPSKKNFFTKYEYREILKYESKKKFDDLIN